MELKKIINLDVVNKKIMDNFFSLSILQVANYILPLITIPYLVRVLGPEKFGLLSFSQAFIQYFIILSDYGFNLSATRKIAISKDDNKKISEIVSAVFIIKAMLVLFGFIIVLLSVIFIHKFNQDWGLYIASYGMVIGNALFPVWYFQGVQRMRYITLLNLLSKIIATITIFVFIKQSSDYIYVPIFNSLGFIISGGLSIFFILRHFEIKFKFVPISEVIEELKDGWHVFISMFSISLYTTTNTVILGFFVSNTLIGYYSAAEKIIRAIASLFVPLFQAFYPHVSLLATKNINKAINLLKKITVIVGAITLLTSICIFIFSKEIIILILGNNYLDSKIIFQLFSPLPFIISMAFIFANLGMLPFKLDRIFSRIYVFGAIYSVSLILFLLYFLNMGIIAAVITNLTTEIILTFLMLYMLYANNINIFSLK